MNTTIRTVLVAPDPGTRQALSQLIASYPQVALQGTHTDYRSAAHALSASPPTLTLVCADADREQALKFVLAVKKANPAAAVVPVSQGLDAAEVLRFVRVGATDFLVLPAGEEDLLALLGRLDRSQAQDATGPGRRQGRIVALAGATGGVGCTAIAVNLAAILAEDKARRVALMDLDLLFGSVAASLNLNPEQTLLDILDTAGRLDHQLLQRCLVPHAGTGLHVLPAPSAIEDSSRVDPEPVGRLISMLTELFDVLVIDTGKSLHITDMLALERCDRILLVVQGDVVNLYHSARLLGLLQRLDRLDDRVRVVLNRVGSEADSISVRKVEGTLGRPVFAQIPNAYRAFQNARTFGAPLERRGAAKRARPALEELTRRLMADFTAPAPADAKARESGRRPRFWSAISGEPNASFQPATG